jgi:protein-disulfide isomerase
MKNFAVGKSFTKGPNNAPVKIYEFSDFQCPYCNKANATIQQVVKKYDGKVQLVFKAFPLNFHKEAPAAHRAALAAGKQGKFWEMHDLLFENFRAFKGADMTTLTAGYAQQLGLNVEQFKKDLADPAIDAQVKAEMAEGSKVGVRGTPNFFVNGTRIVGAQGAPAFEAAIEAALKEAKK